MSETLQAIYDELGAILNPTPDPDPDPPVEPPAPDAPVTEFTFNEVNGLFTISYRSVVIVEAVYSFFINSSFINNDWGQWSGLSTVLTEDGDNFNMVGTQADLGLTLNASTSKSGTAFVYDMEIITDTLINDTIGGGYEFKCKEGVIAIANDDTITLTGDHGVITIAFETPVARMQIQGSNARAFLLSEQVAIETTTNKMTVTMPDGAVFMDPIIERLGGPADDTWGTGILPPHNSPVDLSHLNDTYAGVHGFLGVQGEKLVFEDGTEFKAWATNISALALFITSDDIVVAHAKRIADLGYNVVRIHHHDSNWVRPNIFGETGLSVGDLSEASFQRLDLLINELKKNGVYVFLDLFVGRWWQETDGIDNYDEVVNVDRRGWGFCYINDDIEALMADFASKYLTHENNGTRYIDDPGIIGIVINNENDLTHHFGHALDDQPNSTAKFLAKMEAFGSREGYPAETTWAPWLPGASQKALNDIEHQWNDRQITHIRGLGAQVPLVTTQMWGQCYLKSLPALMDGDIIDCHAYQKYPDYLRTHPAYKNNIVHDIGYTQVNGKPFSCTEWNQEGYPDNDWDRLSLPLYVAAIGCLQDWDALYHFDYGSKQLDFRSWNTPSDYQAHNDPSMIAFMPAAALMFREKHVKKAIKTYAYSVTETAFFDNFVRSSDSAAFRTIIEQSRFVVDVPVTPELSWLTPAPLPEGVIKITDPDEVFLDSDTEIVSDTGELRRDFNKGQYFINTDRTLAITGWLGGHTLTVGGLTVEFDTSYAGVSVQAVDGLPIRQSKKLFITVASRSYPTLNTKDNGSTFLGHPMKHEPLKGSIKIMHSGGLNGDYQDGGYVMEFDNPDTFWFWLEEA